MTFQCSLEPHVTIAAHSSNPLDSKVWQAAEIPSAAKRATAESPHIIVRDLAPQALGGRQLQVSSVPCFPMRQQFVRSCVIVRACSLGTVIVPGALEVPHVSVPIHLEFASEIPVASFELTKVVWFRARDRRAASQSLWHGRETRVSDGISGRFQPVKQAFSVSISQGYLKMLLHG